MHTIPKRPESGDFKEEILKDFIADIANVSLNRMLDKLTETILKYDADDGFDLMVELHNNERMELSRDMLESLDNYTEAVERVTLAAVKEWAQTHDVYSLALPIGTPVEVKNRNIIGTIAGIRESDHWNVAQYKIVAPYLKEGEYYAFNFEDVEVLPVTAQALK